MMKRLLYILIGICCIGCSNFLDDYSQDLVIPKSVSDLDEVILGSAYLPYGSTESLKDGLGWWLHVLDDDINTIIKTSAQSKEANAMDNIYFGYTTWQLEVGRNHDRSSLAADDGFWKSMYNRINAVNIILSEFKNIKTETDKEIKDSWRLKGELHFLRAQFYLTLVNVYGNAYDPTNAETTLGVPLKLTEYVVHDVDKKSQFDRATVAQVYRQIVEDLKVSATCFEQGSVPQSVFRASREAALLLLSRTYLYMQDWTNAQKAAKDFLTLKNNLQSYLGWDSTILLTIERPEVIFTQGKQSLQHAFTGVSGNFCVSGDLYQLYDSLDMRKKAFFQKKDSIGLNMKYENGSNSSYLGDIFMLRTPEGYLNLAEAYAMQGDAANAATYLNQLRAMRINNYVSQTYNQQEIINEVRNERRKELCFEGHRWFDLRRYAVCHEAPLQKVIERVYARYNINDRNMFIDAEVYRLEKGDPAYTFAIPKSVLEFDTDMKDNPRNKREYAYKIVIK